MKLRMLILAIVIVCTAVAGVGAGDRDGAPPRIADPDDQWWDGFGTEDENGLNSNVIAMTVFNGNLIVGGYVTSAGGVKARRIASWDGNAWAPLGKGIDDPDCPEFWCRGKVNALTVFDSNLIVGGYFPSVSARMPATNIARWDGTTWQSFGMGLGTGLDDQVLTVGVYNDELVAGGDFVHAGARLVNGVARWDGHEWNPMGSGFSTSSGAPAIVTALAVYQDQLVACGSFARAGTLTVNRIASWDGDRWNPLGSGLGTTPSTMCVVDGSLVVDDLFQGMLSWDGQSWSGFGESFSGDVNDTVTYNGDLVVAGFFTSIGNRIARWSGTSWVPLGSGVDDKVNALCSHDGGLFVGGDFLTAGGKTSYRIARWNDTTTSVLVEDVTVTVKETSVLLTWRLFEGVVRGVRTVEVQRARAREAPWSRVGWPSPSRSMQFEDSDIKRGSTYWYRLALHALDGSTTFSSPIEVSTRGRRWRTALHAPHTVPSGSVEIRYSIGVPGSVRLDVFDVTGRRVQTLINGNGIPGEYRQPWHRIDSSGTSVASGIYIVRLSAGDVRLSRKLVLVR